MTQSDSQQVQDWMEKGLLHLQCLSYVEALACFNQALHLNPSHSEAWSKCGSVLEKLGCYQEAIAINQTVQHLLLKPELTLVAPNLAENPVVIAANQSLRETSQYWLNRGATLYTLGRDAEAITNYDKAIELSPNNHSAWSNRSLALYYLGHYEDAIASYDKVLELKPNDYYAWTGRAHALIGLDRYEAAIASYNKALDIQPDHSEAVTHLTIALDHIEGIKSRLAKDVTVADFAFEQPIISQDNIPQNSYPQNGHVAALSEVYEPKPIHEPELSPEEVAPENYQDYFWRGNECYALGQYDAAIANYEKTVELKPNYHKAWYNRGISLSKLGQYGAAVASYDRALEIQPDKHQAWLHRGVALGELGQVEEAVASYDKALDLKPDYPEAWAKRGTLLVNLMPPEELGSADDLTVPDLPLFNVLQGNEFNNSVTAHNPSEIFQENTDWEASSPVALSHESKTSSELDPPTFIYEEIVPAVESFVNPNGTVEALVEIEEPSILYTEISSEISPEVSPEIESLADLKNGSEVVNELHEAIFLNEAILNEAILHEDIALELAPQDLDEWDDFGETLSDTEEITTLSDNVAITLPQEQQWMAWDYRGLNELCNQNSKAAFSLWEQGIQVLKSQTHQRYGCGQLYLRKGRAQYSQARKHSNPIPEWITTRDTFVNALEYFTYSDFPEQHLETLQELLRVCHHLGDTYAIEQILPQGTATLASLLQNPNLTRRQKIALESKFAGFWQLQVDVVAQYSESQALELAEATKNRRLSRLRKGWSHQPAQLHIQTLLVPGTAAIYWHLSPAALTTFVLKYNQPPVIVQSTLQSLDQVQHPELRDYPPATYQLQRFEEWMQQWKQSYQQYCDFEAEFAESAPWRQNMEPMLYLQLRKILEINRLCVDYLKDVDHIILIPHRELHLLPLQVLFPGRFTLSYLPCIQLGLDLQQHPPLPIQRLLSAEGPSSTPVPLASETESSSLIFSQLQSTVIAHLYGQVRSLSISSPEATHNKVVSALKMMSGCFHFAGHSDHDLEVAQKSALTLANEEELTLEDILRLDLSRYSLVCLSAGQTGIDNDQSRVIDEYLGLTSGFLSAGVTHVVSTLWPVDEMASSILMIQFHQLLLQKIFPVQALRTAQDWLSTLTYQQLSEWYQALALQLGLADPSSAHVEKLTHLAQVAASEPEPDDMPYGHPFYWAGFTIAGKVPEAPTE
jgi:tetratricopeptide (TPR) repeat protein